MKPGTLSLNFQFWETKLYFSSNRDGNSEIYIMDLDGTNVVNLTKNEAIIGTQKFILTI